MKTVQTWQTEDGLQVTGLRETPKLSRPPYFPLSNKICEAFALKRYDEQEQKDATYWKRLWIRAMILPSLLVELVVILKLWAVFHA